MAGIMDLFRTTPTPAPQNPNGNGTPNNPQGGNNGLPMPGTEGSQNTAPNGVVPANNNPTPNPDPNAPQPSPMDPFKDLWQTKDTSENPSPAVFANIDPKKVMESAKKINFAQVATPDQMKAIVGGGETAATAMMEIMNSVAQSVYAQSALATTKLVDQALIKNRESLDQQLPSMVRKASVSDNLVAKNPSLSNPALAPLVDALTEQFSIKNPSATATEIQTQVMDYLGAVGKMFTPNQHQDSSKGKKGKGAEEDWENFFLG